MILIGSLLWCTWEHSITCSLLPHRYDMASNRWWKESHVPKKAPHNSSLGFVVLDGELHVMTLLNAVDSTETQRKRHHKRSGKLYIQIYHPKKKTWRFLTTKSPFPRPLDFNAAVMCSVRLWASNTSYLCGAVWFTKLWIHFYPRHQKRKKKRRQKKDLWVELLMFIDLVFCHIHIFV